MEDKKYFTKSKFSNGYICKLCDAMCVGKKYKKKHLLEKHGIINPNF